MSDAAPKRIAKILVLVLLCALQANSADAQRLFGQNKVVYSDRDWQKFSDGMVDLYYYEGEEELARETLAIAREAYAEFALWFDHEFEDRLPMILYGSHHDFKQTHTTPGLISEGTAGFTEFAKGRVVLRATGSWKDLWHLVRHEMVHAFMLDKLAQTTTEHGIFEYDAPPLWFIEGLAESLANTEGPDSQARMIIRDALLHDGLVSIPRLWTIAGSFQMYKEGESIVDFMRAQFGDRAPALLIANWWRGTSFAEVLEYELGLDLVELDNLWRRSLDRRIYPEMLRRDPPEDAGQALVRKARAELAPVDVGNGEIACLSARQGGLGLHKIRLGERPGDANFELLVRTGQDDRFESIAPFRSRLDIYEERWLAFTAKNGPRDALYVYDLQAGRIAHRHQPAELIELSSPSFSPDGQSLVFSALKPNGRSDLHILRLSDGTLRQLTDDAAQDIHPDWHPDGGRIIFSSDREDRLEGRLSLWEIDTDGGEPIRRSAGLGSDIEARWSPDGEKILFVSERAGDRDLFALADGRRHRLTRLTGGVYQPAFALRPAASDSVGEATLEILSTVYHRGRFELYRFPWPSDFEADEGNPAILDGIPGDDGAPAVAGEDAVAEDYEVDLGLDFVQSAVALDPDLPTASGASLGFTDLLGEHQLFFHLSTVAQDFSLEDVNAGVSYSRLGSRWNKHFGLFRFSSVRGGLQLLQRRDLERRTGAYAGMTYPFSRFRRVELSTVVRHLERVESLAAAGEPGSSILWSGFVSLVHDNTLWAWTGPQRGMRWNLTLGETVDLRGRGFDRHSIQLDFRHYQPLPLRTVFATRWVQRHSFGGDRQLFPLYGRHDLRGYELYRYAGDHIFLAKTELRIPFVDQLLLGLPFGRLSFPPVQLHLFNDIANVQRGDLDEGWLGSVGYSLSMTLLPPIALRLDVFKKYDFDEIQPGWEADFGIGFGY